MAGKDEKPISARARAVRERIEKEMERKKEEQKQESLRKRIELAKSGLSHFERRDFPKAAQAFVTYLGILEDWKKVSRHGLHPRQFDPKIDAAEMLLIANVYWHLVKLYDKSGAAGEKEFRTYLQLFVLFSKGMRYQPLNAEALRKFIRSGHAVHRGEFRAAYKQLAGSRCFVATSLADHVGDRTIPALRAFRDQVLRERRAGRHFVAWYYRRGPHIAAWLDRRPEWVRRAVALGLDGVAAVAAATAVPGSFLMPSASKDRSSRGRALR